MLFYLLGVVIFFPFQKSKQNPCQLALYCYKGFHLVFGLGTVGKISFYLAVSSDGYHCTLVEGKV